MNKLKLVLILSLCIQFSIAQNKPKVGICLSGGAALGYTHIGVLQALNEYGIEPEIISGSSMGAIIGALYANGVSPEQMLEIIKQEKLYKTSKLFYIPGAKNGLSSHKSLRKLLTDIMPKNSFESLKYPLYICVSNLSNAKWEIVSKGNSLQNYIIASASIPGIFEPVCIGDSIFVDGGLYNNLPSQAIKDKCEYLIGVDVLPYIAAKKVASTREVIMLSTRGLAHNNSLAGRKACDFLIEPTAIETYHEFNFENYLELFQNGYNTTMAYIKEHPEMAKLKTTKKEAK